MLFWYDYTMIALIPALIFSLYASIRVQSTYSKYARVKNCRGMTGAQAAEAILQANGVYDVRIERVPGNLSDHFDPRSKVLRLSNGVHDADSVSAIGIAAHEAGHAVQHAQGYGPLKVRSALVPIVNIATNVAWILFILGLFFTTQSGQTLMTIGIVMFSSCVVFQLVTLPVEINASRRAVTEIAALNLGDEQDVQGVRKVLNAAALTYVAGLITAIAQVLRLLLIRNRRSNN